MAGRPILALVIRKVTYGLKWGHALEIKNTKFVEASRFYNTWFYGNKKKNSR